MKIYVNKSNYGWQTQAKNGEDKLYLDVQFKKGTEPEIMEPDIKFLRINIKDGFFSLYKTKTGLAKPKLVILDYDKISKEEYIPNDEQLSNDDLPF